MNKPANYRKHQNKTTKYQKSLDNNNVTVHEYDIHTVTDYHFQISEPSIRKIYLVVGFILGIIIHKIYIQNIELIQKYSHEAKNFLFNLTPFARNIMSNDNFKYVFNISIICTILVTIVIFITMLTDDISFFISLIISFVFLFAFLYLNFAICHLIIKIPIYFKVLSFIAIIISNIIIGIILWAIEVLILEEI